MTRTAASIFRDFETDGVPASGPHMPVKSEIRAWGAAVDNMLGVVLPTDGSDIGPSVNAALATAQASGGATVLLPPGTYSLQSQIFLNLWVAPGPFTVPGLRLQGAGRQATIIDTRLANDYAVAVNPDWRKAFVALYGITTSAGGSLASATYFVQITMTDPLGNEIKVTLTKSIAVAASGQITVVLPATNAGYSYNLYCDTASAPAHYAQLSGGANATAVAGGQTVQIQAIGSAHAVPTDKIAIWQEAYIADLTISNSTSVANASGLLLFKAGYSIVEDVFFKGLTADGIGLPDYTGDIDGSFNIDIHRCKFDSIQGWGINAAGAVLELSALTVNFCVFNLCGTLPSNLGTAVTVSSIPSSVAPVVGTSTPHNFKSGDQVAFSVAGITLAAAYYRVGGTVTSTTFNLVDLNGNAVDTTGLGAFTSGTVKLAWRPPVWDPVALKTSGSGGIAWLGLICSITNTNFTQCNNVCIYASENGSSDNLSIAQVDCENTAGKGIYVGCLAGGRWMGGELLTANALGATVGGIQLGTGMPSGGVQNFNIEGVKVRSDVTPSTAFEQFQNTSIGGTYPDTIRARNITWTTFDAAGQTRFDGFRFDEIVGTAPFSISATNTAKLGQGFLPIKLKKTGEWVNYHVPAAGLSRGSIGGLTASTRYYFYVQDGALVTTFPLAPAILAPSTTAPAIDAEGHSVLPTDSSQKYIGSAITDGSGNFQTTAPFTSEFPLLPADIRATSSFGYGAGAGGAVTQATSRTTGVTLNKSSGVITTNSASLAAAATARFTVTNSQVAATDTISVSIKSGTTTDQTDVKVQAVAAGSFDIVVANRHASTAETGAVVINFNVVKGVTS